MPISEDEERELRVAVLQADLKLKQAFWETPRNLVAIISAIAAGTAAIAGLAGYKRGQNTPQQPIIIQLAPGVVPVQPAPAK